MKQDNQTTIIKSYMERMPTPRKISEESKDMLTGAALVLGATAAIAGASVGAEDALGIDIKNTEANKRFIEQHQADSGIAQESESMSISKATSSENPPEVVIKSPVN